MFNSVVTRAAAIVFIATWTSGVGQPQPAPRPIGTGIISGVIRDGHTGRPIAGALVYVGITGRGPAGPMSRQLTDPKGRFVFTDLPESDSFFLNASKAGYHDGHYGDTGPVSAGVGAGLVKLGKGDWFRDANIPMFKPAVISGSVTDEAGEPVVGAFVRVLSRIHVAGVPQLAAGPAVRTDDRGHYRIPGLPAGTYLVQVPSVQTSVPRYTSPDQIEGVSPAAARRDDTRPRNNGALDLDQRSLLIIGNYTTPPSAGGRAQAYPPFFAPGATALAEASAITVTAGEVRENVSIALRPVIGVRVAGRVDGPEEAWRGLVVRLMPVGLEGLGEGSEAATALVDDTGAFTFLNVPGGQYTLMAQRGMLEYSQRTRFGGSEEMPRTPGLVPGPSTGISGLASGPPGTQVLSSSVAGDRSFFARNALAVGEADITGLAVPLRRGATVRGRVGFQGDGAPPNPVAIVAEAADGDPATGMYQSGVRVQPGSDDEFVIAGLPPGRFLLRVLGLTPRHALQSIRGPNADHTDRALEIAGSDTADLVITLTDRVAVVQGTVTTEGPPRLLTVIAFPADRALWASYGMSAPRFKAAPVKNDGSFSIPNIPAGDYLLVAVEASQSRRWQEPAFLEAASRVATRVTAEWGRTRTQALKTVVIK